MMRSMTLYSTRQKAEENLCKQCPFLLPSKRRSACRNVRQVWFAAASLICLLAAVKASINGPLTVLQKNIQRRHTTLADVLEKLHRVNYQNTIKHKYKELGDLCVSKPNYKRACELMGLKATSTCKELTRVGNSTRCFNISSIHSEVCDDLELYCKDCPNEALTKEEGVVINFEPYHRFAMLAVQNANILSELVHKQYLPDGTYPSPTDTNATGAAAGASCEEGHNFFGEGNIVFNTLSRVAIQSNKIVLAIGCCLGGNGSYSDNIGCHYTLRNVIDNKTNELIHLYEAYPRNKSRQVPSWFSIAQHRVSEFLNLTQPSVKDMESFGLFPANMTVFFPNSLRVGYDEQLWSYPYFDCTLGHRWMVTYSTPVLHYVNRQLKFIGMTGVDIDLSDIPINQCSGDHHNTTNQGTGFENLFRNTDLCEPVSTFCEPQRGGRFELGSYFCHCRKGFYKPGADELGQYFYGKDLEKLDVIGDCDSAACIQRRTGTILANLTNSYRCLPCPSGCDTCLTGREVCLYNERKEIVYSLLAVNSIVLVMSIFLLVFVIRHRKMLIIKSASWPFLALLIVGAQLAYVNLLQIGVSPKTKVSCTIFTWLKYMAFAVSYGAIVVKTWRIYKIFDPRMIRGHKSNLSNRDLVIRLSCIVLAFMILICILTLASNLEPTAKLTSSGQKYDVCRVGLMTNTTHAVAFLLFAPMIYMTLRLQLRKVTGDYVEKSEITVSAYFFILFELLIIVSENTLMITPDMHVLIASLDIHLTFTLTLTLFFARKVKLILQGQGNRRRTDSVRIIPTSEEKMLQRRNTMVLTDVHTSFSRDEDGNRSSRGSQDSRRSEQFRLSFRQSSNLTDDSGSWSSVSYRSMTTQARSESNSVAEQVFLSSMPRPSLDFSTHMQLTPVEEDALSSDSTRAPDSLLPALNSETLRHLRAINKAAIS